MCRCVLLAVVINVLFQAVTHKLRYGYAAMLGHGFKGRVYRFLNVEIDALYITFTAGHLSLLVSGAEGLR